MPTPSAERITVLVIGTDSSAARRAGGEGVNADAIHVVSVSPDRSQLAIVSLPRDTVDLPMPDGSLWTGKVNALYGALGAEGVRDALETLYGIEIDRYVAIDMDDFVRIVDAVGGIDIALAEPVYDPSIDWGLAAGTHHLDGATALRFARTRYGDDDYARNARQQQVLVALRDRLLALDEPIDVAALLGALGSLDTDMTPADHATLIDAASAGTDADVATIVLRPPRFAHFEGIEGPVRGWVMIPNVEEIRAAVQSLIAD
jgi:LCP family protein required for cell wall assembly